MSDITLSASIMAHPKRAAFIPELLEWLGDFGIPVVWDERNDRWDTGRRSMLAYDPACSHHAVIQDDVLPCKDLLAGLTKALEYAPADAPVCGYVGAKRPNAPLVNAAVLSAAAQKASWITMHTLNWGPLICVPTNIIPEMIAYCDPLTTIANYDRRLSRYWELRRGVRIWYTWPPLVDHRDGPSMVEGRVNTVHHSSGRGCRVAHSFIGQDRSALDCDWTGPVVHAENDAQAGRYYGPVVTYRHKQAGKLLTIPANSHRVEKLDRHPSWEFVT
jgi:hypothetical protein